MFLPNSTIIQFITVVGIVLVIRFLSKSSICRVFKQWWRSFEDRFHVYQFYKVPRFNEHMQENQLYRTVYTYLNALPCVEDSDFTNLFSVQKSNEINLVLDSNQTIVDNFFSARMYWIDKECERTGSKALILKIRKIDKRRILRPYLQHIHAVFEGIEQKRKEVKLYINTANHETDGNGRWTSVPFTHPATMETVVMDSDLKNKVKSDLEVFLKSRQYYHRLGRLWKRSYLLYGPSGTGKSSFVAAMAKLLCFDVYDIDLCRVSDDTDLKILLLQTTNKSMIVVEDLDRYLAEKSSALSLSGVLSFMDGFSSCCGEERVMVFTVSGKDQIDPTVLRPGRIDVHIQFPLCDFSAFKTLASSYLGVKDHKLFPHVEEIFQTGASLSPAEIGEIMISNRNSPSRALKTVITALQTIGNGRASHKIGPRLSSSSSGRSVEEINESGIFCREGVNAVKEFRKLYGLLRICSGRKESLDMDSAEKENSRARTT